MGGDLGSWGSKQRQHYKMKNVGQGLGYMKYPGCSIVPNGAIVRMKFAFHTGALTVPAANGAATATGAGWVTNVWRGNSVYDCDVTGTGGGAANAYEFANSGTSFGIYYSGSLCTGSKVSIDAFGVSAGALATTGVPRDGTQTGFDTFSSWRGYLIPCAGQPSAYTTQQDIGTSSGSGAWQKCEIMPYTQRRVIWPNPYGQIAPFSHIRYNYYMSTKKMLRAETPKQLAQNLGGSTLPAQQWYWHLCVDNHGATAGTLYFDIEIVYFCIFFDRKMIDGATESVAA